LALDLNALRNSFGTNGFRLKLNGGFSRCEIVGNLEFSTSGEEAAEVEEEEEEEEEEREEEKDEEAER